MSHNQYTNRRKPVQPTGEYSAFRATTTAGYIRVDRAVARALGGVEAGAFFHELAWRSEDDRYTRADGWIDVTVAELEESAVLSRRQQDRIRKHLTELGVIITKREGVPARLFYQIDWQEIEERVAINGEMREQSRQNQLHQNVQLDAPERATSYTEGAMPVAPFGVTHNRERTTKELKGSPSFFGQTPMWERLDPIADRELIMRDRFRRPEAPSPGDADPELVMTWHQLQRDWDKEWDPKGRLR